MVLAYWVSLKARKFVGNWDVEEDCWRVVEGEVLDWTASLQLPETGTA